MRDYKTALQELTQAKFGVTPEYILLGSSGPDHKKSFEMAALVGGRRLSSAVGASKKEAEQKCAQIAIELLQNGASHGSSAQNSEQTACGDAQSGASRAQDGKKGSRNGDGRAHGSKKSDRAGVPSGTLSAKRNNERNKNAEQNGRDTDKQSGGDQGDAL